MALKEKSNLTLLPLELKVKIFRMLTDYTDARSMTAVSHEWRKVGEDPKNWRIKLMTISFVPWKDIEIVLRLREIFEKYDQLKTLRLVNVWGDEPWGRDFERLVKMFDEHDQISKLILYRCTMLKYSCMNCRIAYVDLPTVGISKDIVII